MQKYTLVNAALNKGSLSYKKILIIMKLVVALVIISVFSVSASTYSQTLTISKKAMDLPRFFKMVNDQTGYAFVFNKEILSNTQPVDLNVKNAPMETVLKNVLNQIGLKYEIKYKTIIITEKEEINYDREKEGSKNLSLNPYVVKFQQQRITGKVYDDEGKSLPGATVQILGKTVLKLNTDKDGAFTANLIATDTAIRVSFVGYKMQLVRITPGKTNYKFTLAITDASLKNVVVTGIFDRPKESFTGAVTVITKEQIKMFGNRNLLKTIANIDPSFSIEERTDYGSNPNILPDISIRGTSALPLDLNNIQGTNIRNAYNLPLFILDGFEVSLERVMDMNQNDVESVVILKDASSTAAYGARGANGVIVITSIKPVPGKIRVSYSAGLNLEIPDFSSYNLLNSTDKLALENLAGLYSATDISSQDYLNTLYNKNLKATMEGVNTNWAKVPTQTGVGQVHSIGLSGGDAEFRYTINGSYNQITGAMKGSKRDNFNGGMTIMYLLKKVRFTNNLSIGFNNSANSTWGSFKDYVTMNPYWAPYDDNGNTIKQYSSFSQADSPLNPAFNGSLTDFDKTKYTVVRNSTAIDWDVIKGLKFSNSLGYSRQIGSTDNFKSPSNTAFIQNTTSNKGSYFLNNAFQQGYQVRSNLSYGTTIGKGTLYGGINAQVTEDRSNSNTVSATGFSNDKQTDISNAINSSRPSTTEKTTRTIAASATMSYTYDSRFFVDGNYNTTGASSFGADQRFGSFWSAGIGWTVSNERFFKEKLPQINSLRLRYNYGITGSVNFDPYQSLSTYSYDRTALYRTLSGANLATYGNKDLKWQQTYQQNAGFDLSIFDNRLSLSANYYLKKTKNAITTAYLTYSHGFDSYIENLGQIDNKGYDLTASYFVIKNPERKLYWSVTTAISHNKNVLTKLSDALKKANASLATSNSTSSVNYQYVEGQSTDELYVLVSPGVDVATGKVLYVAADGTLTNAATGDLLKVAVGDRIPKINGRLSSMVRVGQFSANVGFSGRFGGKKVNFTLLNKVENAFARTNVDQRVFDLRWAKPGDVTAFKALGATTATFPNTRFVFTENTITLSNINLSYSLPTKWIKRLNVQQLSIAASMSDIGYWSNIEQERGTEYPYSLKPTFSLSCTF